jgi:C-terminal processing protease CtpA/Prc
MAILISPRTFSGGEALAYELQAYGRALVAGERSGGAANATVMLPLPGDFAITVPHRQPRHAITGTNWEGVGVRPDLAVPAVEAETRARDYLLKALER